MESPALAATRPKARFHVDPLTTVAIVAFVLSFAVVVLWNMLFYSYGLEVSAWRVPGFAVVSLLALALLWNERRRFLSHPRLEPGAHESSWSAAADDLLSRRRLENPPSLTLIALFVALIPWLFWWWQEAGWAFGAVVGSVGLVIVADHLARRRAARQGLTRTVEGSDPPPGWRVFGAMAVGLPLVWLPLALMAAAAGEAKPLLLLAIPLLHAAAWWGASHAWRRPLRIDLELPDVPIDWRRRQRDQLISLLPFVVLWGDWYLFTTAALSTFDEVLGRGCASFLSYILGWMVMLGFLATGWAFFTRPLRASAAQPAASLSRQPASASAARRS